MAVAGQIYNDQVVGTESTCLICLDLINSKETPGTESPELLLKNIARVLEVSPSIYSGTALESLSIPFLCSSCHQKVSSAIEFKEVIARLEAQLQRLAEVIKENFILGYRRRKKSNNNYFRNECEEVKERIRKTYAQCWGPCWISISQLPVGNEDEDNRGDFKMSSEDMMEGSSVHGRQNGEEDKVEEIYIKMETAMNGFDYEDVEVPAEEVDDPLRESVERFEAELMDGIFSDSNALSEEGDEEVDNYNYREGVVVPGDFFREEKEDRTLRNIIFGNKTCPECKKVFTRATGVKRHFESPNVPCGKGNFIPVVPQMGNQTLTLENPEASSHVQSVPTLHATPEDPIAVGEEEDGQGFSNGTHFSFGVYKSEIPGGEIQPTLQGNPDGYSTLQPNPQFGLQSQMPPETNGKCPICNLVLSRELTYEEHVRSHKDETDFPCQQCPARFPLLRDLRMHIYGKHKHWAHYCEPCQINFPNFGSHYAHQKNEHGIFIPPCMKKRKPFECMVCRQRFKDKDTFDLHTRQHKDPAELLPPNIQATFDDHRNVIAFECELCSEKFQRESYTDSENQFRILCQHGNCSCNATFKDLKYFMNHHKDVCTKSYWKSRPSKRT